MNEVIMRCTWCSFWLIALQLAINQLIIDLFGITEFQSILNMKIRFGGETIVQFVYCIEYIESEACSYFERYWSSYVSLSVSHCKFSVVEAWQEMLLSNFIFIAIAQFTIWGRTMSAPKLERNQGERKGIRGIIRWFFYLKVVNSPMKWSRKEKKYYLCWKDTICSNCGTFVM